MLQDLHKFLKNFVNLRHSMTVGKLNRLDKDAFIKSNHSCNIE